MKVDIGPIKRAKTKKSMPSTIVQCTNNAAIQSEEKDNERPDEAFVTSQAKRKGLSNASSGRIRVTCPAHHFGPISAEHDPERGTGVLVGETWSDRMHCRQWGAHRPHVAGIAGQAVAGAQSIILSGALLDACVGPGCIVPKPLEHHR